MTTDTVASVGAIIGSLVGTIALLLRFLVSSKNGEIRTLEDELRDVRAERDLYRSLTLADRGRRGEE